MAYKDPEQKKIKSKEYYERTRKNNPEFKARKKERDREYHKGYKNPHLTPERSREYCRAYKKRNAEVLRIKNREAKRLSYPRDKEVHKKYMAAHPEKRKQYEEKYKKDGRTAVSRLKYRYGITPADISKLLEDQNGLCPVCLESFEHRKKYIDHDHKTKKVRGIVHMQCNTLMGHAKDDPAVLERAAQYLRRKQ